MNQYAEKAQQSSPKPLYAKSAQSVPDYGGDCALGTSAGLGSTITENRELADVVYGLTKELFVLFGLYSPEDKAPEVPVRNTPSPKDVISEANHRLRDSRYLLASVLEHLRS